MAWAAQWAGVCNECGERFGAGTPIMHDGAGGYAHAGQCPNTLDEDEAAKRAPRCGRCGLNHPGEC